MERDAALIEPLWHQRLERFARDRRHLIRDALGFEPAAEVPARRTWALLSPGVELGRGRGRRQCRQRLETLIGAGPSLTRATSAC